LQYVLDDAVGEFAFRRGVVLLSQKVAGHLC
jgi:hypothetical protein